MVHAKKTNKPGNFKKTSLVELAMAITGMEGMQRSNGTA